MKAVIVEGLAEDFSRIALREIPTPEPGPGDVRVRVRAASLNFPDLLMLRGAYQHKPDLPFIPGMDFAGEIDAVGEGVSGLQPGDRVAGGGKSGGFAEYRIAHASELQPIPAAFSFAAAAAYPATHGTAHVSLVHCARIEPGEWLLVHGASGGVGLAALDAGRILGARLIAATGSAEKAERLAPFADHVLVSRPGFRDAVKAITGGEGADVILDPVGGEVFDESTRCIAFGGRLLVVGFAGGRAADLRTNIALIKGFSVLGVRAGEYQRRRPAARAVTQRTIWDWAERGLVNPLIYAELPLERYAEAYALMRDRKLVGKVVLTP